MNQFFLLSTSFPSKIPFYCGGSNRRWSRSIMEWSRWAPRGCSTSSDGWPCRPSWPRRGPRFLPKVRSEILFNQYCVAYGPSFFLSLSLSLHKQIHLHTILWKSVNHWQGPLRILRFLCSVKRAEFIRFPISQCIYSSRSVEEEKVAEEPLRTHSSPAGRKKEKKEKDIFVWSLKETAEKVLQSKIPPAWLAT